MPRTIDPIKLTKLKSARKRGLSKKQALLHAGYSPNTSQHHANDITGLKWVDNKIVKEITAKDVTIELVLNNLFEDRRLAMAKGDMGTVARVDELLGKFLKMFTERREIDMQADITENDKSILHNYINSNRLQQTVNAS